MYRKVEVLTSNLAARDYTVLPRRKAGQAAPLGERAPVFLTKDVLANYFSMPLRAAAKELVRNSRKFEICAREII